jgi:hypothetical protein
MKTRRLSFLFIFFTLFTSSVFAADGFTYHYAMTPECITGVSVEEKSEYWQVVISLNEFESQRLQNFSSKHIGDKLRLVDGNAQRLPHRPAPIATSLDSPFVLGNLVDRETARELENQLTGSDGLCGPVI